MRSVRIAESILSLVSPSQRAAALAGDLAEESGARGSVWFWTAVVRATVALVGLEIRRAPVRLAAFGVLSWFIYMLISVVLVIVSFAGGTLLWAIAYVFDNHTGLELLTTALSARIESWIPPRIVLYGLELLMLVAAAPFQVGRMAARWWAGRELVAWIAVIALWPVMGSLVPLVGYQAAASLRLLPWILASTLLGVLWNRFRGAHNHRPTGA